MALAALIFVFVFLLTLGLKLLGFTLLVIFKGIVYGCVWLLMGIFFLTKWMVKKIYRTLAGQRGG